MTKSAPVTLNLQLQIVHSFAKRDKTLRLTCRPVSVGSSDLTRNCLQLLAHCALYGRAFWTKEPLFICLQGIRVSRKMSYDCDSFSYIEENIALARLLTFLFFCT